MKRSSTLKLLSALLTVFMVFNFAQAQWPPNPFTAINITVTTGANDTPVAGYPMLLGKLGDTTMMPIMTDENGTYTATVLKNETYVIKSLNDNYYQAFTDTVAVDTSAVEHAIHLEKRNDLFNVSGNVSFKGGGVPTTLYFQMLSDSVDINDFRDYESHFVIPGMLLQWASYNTESGADGNFSLEMVDGKYVVYIPATDTTLAHWGVFEITADTQLDSIQLQQMSSLSGHVTGTDGYDNVTIFAYSLNAGRPAMAMVDANGDYSLEVAPGEYVVRLQAFFDCHMYMVYYDSAYTPGTAQKVKVDQNGATDIDFTLPPAQVSQFSVSGTVTNRNGDALAGAEVGFVSYNYFSNLFKTYLDTTDANGQYTVNGETIMAEDSLLGFAWKDSTYFLQFYNGQASYLTADPIIYHAGENVTGIDFVLDSIDASSGYSISGTVVDENGNPVAQGEVQAFTSAVNIGVITTQIDSTGHYAFDPVFPSGSEVVLEAWGGFGYLPSIYDGAESWADATPVEITNADVSNINFTLKEVAPSRLPLGTIKGVLNLGSGNQLAKASTTSEYAGAVVYVRPQGTEEWTGYDYVDDNGHFELPVEKDGVYDVKLSTRDDGDITGTATVKNLQSDITLSVTGISKDGPIGVIHTSRLYDAYPNPFNPSTTIKVDMAKTAQASLTIYDVLGQKVKTLFNGNLNKGSSRFVWNGTDNSGRKVASGLYFYQLKTKDLAQTKAVMLIK